MPALVFTPLPTAAQFKSATDLTMVTSGRRAGDTAINVIDGLLDIFHRTRNDANRVIVLGRLYFATDTWLKLCDRGSAEINTRRRSSVYEFYKKLVARLTEETRVPVNLLPNWLEATFGRAMGAHGADVDLRDRAGEYMEPKKAAIYRLVFVRGLAFRQKWWANSTELVLADSIERDARQAAVIAAGFSGYVVSQGGDFYSGPHWAGTNLQKNGRFHSSYLAGDAVRCAGEIKMEQGVVVQINNNSGHFQPGANNLALAVETLALLGVDMKRLIVSGFNIFPQSGRQFLDRLNSFGGQGVFGFNRPARPGDTPLGRHEVATTLGGNAAARTNAPDYRFLASHWQPRSKGMPAHGHAGKDRCRECQSRQHLWPNMIAAINAAGGIDKLTARSFDMLPSVTNPALGRVGGVNGRPNVPAPVGAMMR
ncbi:hypothetical protein ACQW02_04880 [Humitalea sp. 24SJ18S-53]|uniref:hypothetical protein n=1 Tax=Humitalea sp. 24SJ18S-53 TaxID=3422307 RepID=UPI003D67B66D